MIPENIKHRIEQAKDAAQTAEVLLTNNKLGGSVDRIYYGMFYMVSALALKEGLEIRSDEKMLEWFSSEIRNKRILESRYFEMFDQAYQNRMKVDYDIKVDLHEGDIKVMLDTLKEFIEVLEDYITTGQFKPLDDDDFPELPDLTHISITPSDAHMILVPWDFTDIAWAALQHAIQYKEKAGGKISLLHIVKRDKDRPEAEEKINADINKAEKEFGYRPEYIIREGTIFSEISAVASDLNAKLVVMGTHGIKGMQKLTGSWALKVIVDTKSPFIVVQAPPVHKSIQNVVFPVDYRREVKQKLSHARNLAMLYKVKFHICIPENITSALTLQKTNNNLAFVKSYFRQNNIDFEVHTVKGTSDFAEATLKYAKETSPDLIIIMVTKDITLADYIWGAEEQKIISNDAKIPVMCVNPPHGGNYSYKVAMY